MKLKCTFLDPLPPYLGIPTSPNSKHVRSRLDLSTRTRQRVLDEDLPTSTQIILTGPLVQQHYHCETRAILQLSEFLLGPATTTSTSRSTRLLSFQKTNCDQFHTETGDQHLEASVLFLVTLYCGLPRSPFICSSGIQLKIKGNR